MFKGQANERWSSVHMIMVCDLKVSDDCSISHMGHGQGTILLYVMYDEILIQFRHVNLHHTFEYLAQLRYVARLHTQTAYTQTGTSVWHNFNNFSSWKFSAQYDRLRFSHQWIS